MKRYQCIKDFLPFAKGNTYPDIFGSPSHEGGADLITHDGRVYEVTRSQLSEHFQELIDLNVDVDQVDHEANAYIALQPVRGCLHFIAICFAVAVAGGLFLYLALTWRS